MASRSGRGKNDTGTSSRETDSASKEQLKSYIPLKASSWKQGHLREIGIFYDEKCSNLDEIISRLKEQLKVRHTLADLPNIGKRLVQLTKEIWTFSVDLSEKSAETITYGNRETNHLVQKFASEDNELRAQFRNSSGEERLYSAWSSGFFSFFGNLKKFLIKWSNPRLGEAKFTHLFNLFARIALLDPESGEDDKATISVGGVTIHGSPDVRFNSFADFESDICGILKLIVVTEVKQFEALRGDYNEGTFIASNISSRVLGQHGIELLMERSDSFFLPGIAGMICMGTKIVFTYLFIKESHYVKILEKGPDIDDTLKSTILYTRPYDYMDMRDRNEILESFFWFGFVQSSAYKAYMFEV